MPNIYQPTKDAKIYIIKHNGKDRFHAAIRIEPRKWKNSWHFDIDSAKAWLMENIKN